MLYAALVFLSYLYDFAEIQFHYQTPAITYIESQQGFIMRVICRLFMQIGLSDFRYELWCPCFRFDLVPVNPCLTLPFLAFPYLTLRYVTLRYVMTYLALPGLALPFLTTITAMMITDRVYQFFKC